MSIFTTAAEKSTQFSTHTHTDYFLLNTSPPPPGKRHVGVTVNGAIGGFNRRGISIHRRDMKEQLNVKLLVYSLPIYALTRRGGEAKCH